MHHTDNGFPPERGEQNSDRTPLPGLNGSGFQEVRPSTDSTFMLNLFKVVIFLVLGKIIYLIFF